MDGLNDNHKRRILACFQHGDGLLENCLRALNPASTRLFSRYVPDIAPAESQWLQTRTERIREELGRLMDRFEAKPQPAATRTSWVLRTSLMSLDIALEDIYPNKMRGYGEVDPTCALELSRAIDAIRDIIRDVLTNLKDSRDSGAGK